MNHWFHLVKKEIRLGLPAFLIPVIAFIVAAGIAFYLGHREGMGFDVLFIVAMMATGMQVFYLVYYLFYSLQAERKKLHIWLHNPMSARALLSAKVVAGLVTMIATLFITGGTALIVLPHSKVFTFGYTWSLIFEAGSWGGIHLILIALSLGIGFIFLWMIFLYFTRFIGSFVSFLLTFVLFIVIASATEWFAKTKVYAALTMWGEFKLDSMITSLNVSVDQTHAEVFSEMGDISLFFGTYVYETILAIIIFLVSCWILDRKVEV